MPSLKRLRWIITLGRIVAVVYLVLVLILDLAQDILIFPGSMTQGTSQRPIEQTDGVELIPLKTAEGERIFALFATALDADGYPHRAAAACPTLLFFVGNGECLGNAQTRLIGFRRLGVNVMIPEYVGYGMSEGSPSERGCRSTGLAVLAHLRGRSDIDPNRIILAGTSLGGAVAIDLAASQDVAGLMAFSSFTTLAEAASLRYPFVPTHWLLKPKFMSRAKIGRVRCPIFLGHGTEDRVVPAWMSDTLAASATATTEVTVRKIVGAGHNLLFKLGGPGLSEEMTSFIRLCEAKLTRL